MNLSVSEFITIVAFILLGYICIYSIVERICKCIEHKAIAESYAKFNEGMVKYEQSGNAKSSKTEK
jgi:hypothetical protein